MNDSWKFENIFPVSVVSKYGKIENEESLLNKKILQITTNETDFVTITNNNSRRNSYILLDFGREIHGRVRILTCTGNAACPPEMRITYGESVSEALSNIGHQGATNDHSVRDTIFRFPDFSDMSLNESGFRFVKLELLSKNTSINIKAIIAESKMRDIEYLGSFESSSEELNRIYNTAAYTCHMCMQQFIWDGIKRDRLVWVGDMHPEMLAVKTVFGNNKIIDESLNFMRETTPLPNWMNGMPTYSLWWLIILWDWYFYTGNENFINENKDYALKLIKTVTELINDDGSDNLPSYFLDWPCNGKKAGISGSRALLAWCLEKSAELCNYFNDTQLSEICMSKKKILISTPAKNYGAKQVEAFFSISGWKNEKEAGEFILNNGSKGFSTFMSYYLLKSASKYDMSKTLEALEEYYGTMLKMGATSFWEDFDIEWAENAFGIDKLPVDGKKDIHGDFGAFCYKGLRHSLCHGWSSGPVAFLAEDVLGIKPMAAGCKKIRISPDLGNLEFAKGTYPTPYGVIKVSVLKNNNGNFYITYEAPKEIEIIL
ncbi:MAG: alpha-L-rhamnosidase [Ruminococcaceae bacterium]|nr:alpha-L-rhamnosidase [Oscillospiraceae bacterium]